MTEHNSLKPSPAVDAAWLEAFQETQRQMVEAHARFQEALTEGHRAFMHAMEHAQTQLAKVAMQQQLAAPSALNATRSIAPLPSPSTTKPTPPKAIIAPAPQPIAAPRQAPPSKAPTQAAAPRLSASLPKTLISVVEAKTGYPASMLSLDMELEGDLGVDSIKRVEIFSALKEAVPSLPELDGAQMAQLRSLQDILSALEQAVSSPAAQPKANGHSAAPSREDLASVLISVVEAKTGYPASMLSLDMELEGDLGVDSIKRVEIFSALKEAVPSLPELDGAQMAQLRSLQDILSALLSTLSHTTGQGVAAFF